MAPVTPQPSVELMNSDLQRLYDSYLPKIHTLIDKCGWTSDDEVSQIFTLHVDELYAQSPYKILFVGRETFGWGLYNQRTPVVELMKSYSDFSHSGEYPNSPFWWFRRDFSQKFGITEADFMKATLWTNVSKIDVRKTRPSNIEKQFDKLVQVFIQLLVTEIAIVNPDVVVIMTRDGFYNWHLENYNWQENKTYFDSNPVPIKVEKRRLYGVRVEQLMGGGLLPAQTYQMCHPNALRFRGGYNQQSKRLIDAICQHVVGVFSES